jgi:hypothetical protein
LLAYSYRCRILWLQGFADQALCSVESHLVAARASDHPYSLFSGLLQTGWPQGLRAQQPAMPVVGFSRHRVLGEL